MADEPVPIIPTVLPLKLTLRVANGQCNRLRFTAEVFEPSNAG